MRKYTHALTVSIADTEVEVDFEFTCSPYIPEQGPTYSSGGQPAEGGEVEVTEAFVLIGKDSHKAPAWLIEILANDESVIEELRSCADDDGEPDWDAINDARRDERAA